MFTLEKTNGMTNININLFNVYTMRTLTSAIIVEYDIQLIYEELKEYGHIIPKYKIKELYFKLNHDVVDVIIYFLEYLHICQNQ